MPKSKNEVRIAGHCTEPKRSSGNGPTRFSINTGGGNRKEGEGKWPACWHRIVVWPKSVPEVAELTKGKYVEVVGRIEYPAYDEKWHKSLEEFVKYGKGCEIIATELHFDGEKLGPAPETNVEITDDDIPF